MSKKKEMSVEECMAYVNKMKEGSTVRKLKENPIKFLVLI